MNRGGSAPQWGGFAWIRQRDAISPYGGLSPPEPDAELVAQALDCCPALVEQRSVCWVAWLLCSARILPAHQGPQARPLHPFDLAVRTSCSKQYSDIGPAATVLRSLATEPRVLSQINLRFPLKGYPQPANERSNRLGLTI